MRVTKKQQERRVMELSATLPSLRPIDNEWINTNYRTKWKSSCLCYYVIFERKAEFQVIRWYFKSRKRQFEVMQIWLNEDTEVVLARKRFMRYDGWVTDSEMRPKRIQPYAAYSYLGDVRNCPASEVKIRSLLPILKRNGLRSSIHNLYSPYQVVKSLLNKPRLETLWKLKQYHLFDYYYWGNRLSDEEWQSIRIALRHGYHFGTYRQIHDWTDMIRMMEECGADTRNPQLICPTDLKAAHDHWHRASDRLNERMAEERAVAEHKDNRSRAEDYEPFFHATREQFLDMVFTDGEIVIKAIPTAVGIVDEGKAMHHCVAGYYNKPNSLILSAKVNGERVETIEVNLTTYELIQSRGLQNCSTKFHDRIVELVNGNLDIIRVLNNNHKRVEQKKLKELREEKAKKAA